MTEILRLITKIYTYLVVLYPRRFREDFRSEMLSDFSDMAVDASKKGIFSLILYCLREFMEFPANLLRIHVREGRMFTILRSQPISSGLRGAVGFGVAFAIANTISMFVALKLAVADDSIVGRLQVYFFDLFHTEHGLELISWLPSALGSLITGLILGILFALLFADRSKYPRYILVGMLGWFLHDAVRSILWYSSNLEFFLGARHSGYLSIATSILSGSFLGLMFAVVRSENLKSTRLLIAGSIAYPLIAYLYVRLLYELSIITTPWMFIALMILMIVYIGTIFLIAIRSEGSKKMPWMIVAGAVGYPVMTYLVYFIGQLILPPVPSWGILTSERPFFWLEITVSNGIYGILFGLLLGLVSGFHKKNNLPQITT